MIEFDKWYNEYSKLKGFHFPTEDPAALSKVAFEAGRRSGLKQKTSKVVYTNLGLGYQELAYFIKISNNVYICVCSPNVDTYAIGETLNFNCSEHIELVSCELSDIPNNALHPDLLEILLK